MISVVNIKTYKAEDDAGTLVYVGRRMPSRAGSPLGNPFKPSSYRIEAARQACIE